MEKQQPTALHKFIATFLLLAGGGGVVLMIGAANTPETAAQRAASYCDDQVAAVIMSERFVSRSLKSPSTAKYPSANDARVSKTGACSFRVVSYVDAQNGFGAMLRSSYSADMEYLPTEDTWRGSNIVVQ